MRLLSTDTTCTVYQLCWTHSLFCCCYRLTAVQSLP